MKSLKRTISKEYKVARKTKTKCIYTVHQQTGQHAGVDKQSRYCSLFPSVAIRASGLSCLSCVFLHGYPGFVVLAL